MSHAHVLEADLATVNSKYFVVWGAAVALYSPGVGTAFATLALVDANDALVANEPFIGHQGHTGSNDVINSTFSSSETCYFSMQWVKSRPASRTPMALPVWGTAYQGCKATG